MKKVILTLTLVLATAVSANAQLLYKISGNGLAKPSFIIGTYHLAPVSFTDSIPGLKEALDAAEQEYGELDMVDLMSAENTQKMQAAMMLPEGQTLDKLLTTEQMARVNGLLKTLMGVDMTNPMVAQQLGKMTPQALTLQMSLLMFIKKNPDFNPQESFDDYFQQVIAKAGKPVKGFETVDFQVDALLKGSPMDRQIENLMCMVDNQEWQEEMAEEIVNAFFSQDLKAIEAALDAKLNNSCDDTPEERDRLIYNRNANWLKMMPQIMKEKSTFFAVGAAHLVGEKGVLTGLKNAGFTVEPTPGPSPREGGS
ncbi:MAG: TraB/GumN family protein [Prevotella sp.]|nr:TraB/GumN family protein [Prevotella sp.]